MSESNIGPDQPSHPHYHPPAYLHHQANSDKPLPHQLTSQEAVIGLGCLGLIIACIVILIVNASAPGGSSQNIFTAASALTTASVPATSAPVPTAKPIPTSTPKPKPTPTATESPTEYKNGAMRVSPSDIAKSPNDYIGSTVTFRAQILSFVPDSSGNTAAANVVDPNDPTTVILVEFSPFLDIQQINKGDTVIVWGQGAGAVNGTNAFGGSIVEGAIQEVYLHDTTTGYNDDMIPDPAAYVNSLP